MAINPEVLKRELPGDLLNLLIEKAKEVERTPEGTRAFDELEADLKTLKRVAESRMPGGRPF